jgi:flagellar hook-associated protein 2
LASYGLSVERDGTLTFDQSAFTAAYTADRDAVQAAFVGPGGFASRVEKMATTASDPYIGTLTQDIVGRKAEIDRYNDQISAWDDRLALKQASLERMYSNLEAQLSKLQSQQSWLAGQIESLDGLSSSSGGSK